MSWQRLSRRSEHYHDLAYRADGQILVAGSAGGWVRWWATATGAPLRISMYQRRPLWSVALTPDGQRVAGGLEDGTIALWPEGQPHPPRRLPSTSGQPVLGLRWAPEGQHLLAWDADGFRLWSLAEAAPLWEHPAVPGGVASIAASADGRWLATAGWHGPAHLWRAADGAWLHTWEAHWLMEPALAFDPVQPRLALGYGDGGVGVWSVPRVERLQDFAPLPHLIRALAYRPDGTYLAAGDATGAITLWTGEPPQEIRVQLGGGPHLRGLAFTPDGRALRAVRADGQVAEWTVRPGPTLVPRQRRTTSAPDWPLRQVVFAPDGQSLAALTADDAVWLWRPSFGAVAAPPPEAEGLAARLRGPAPRPGRTTARSRPRRNPPSWQTLSAPAERYTSVAFAADGTVLVAGTDGGAVRWWVVADGAPLPQPMQGNAPITSVALDPAGDLVAAGRADGEVRLWHPGMAWPTRLVPGTGRAIRGVAFAPDGQHLLVWDAASVGVWNPAGGPAVWTVSDLPGGVAQAAWGLGGTWVVTAGAGGPVSLWQGADGQLLRRWEGTAEPVVAVGGGGQVLAFTATPKEVQVWRVPEGGRLYEMWGGPGVIRSLACTPWGSVLAVGTSTGAVALSTDDGPHIVEGLSGAVQGLAFTPSTGRLVTVTEEGTVTTWAAPAGPLLRRLDSWPLPAPGDRVQQVAFAPDRRAVAVVTEDAAVWLWRDPTPADSSLFRPPPRLPGAS